MRKNRRGSSLHEVERWKEAGRIAAIVREEVKNMVKPGVSILKLCEKGEKLIRDLGGKPAFPLNVSQNEIAAHYTSPPKDKRKLKEGVVKIDVGVQKDGYIGDTAVTVPVGNVSDGIKEGIKAIGKILAYTLEGIKADIWVKTISKRIKTKAHELGFGVVSDLNGHQITRGNLHGELSIPSDPASISVKRKVKKGVVIAVEPFITLGRKDGETRPRRDFLPIYSVKNAEVMQTASNSFLTKIVDRFGLLPFAVRWLTNGKTDKEVLRGLSKLSKGGKLNVYPVLEETKERIVLQKEHTLFVQEDGVEVLTTTKDE